MSSGVAGILIVIVVAAAILGARAWVDDALRRRARALWVESCEHTGLSLADADSHSLPRAQGVVDGRPVEAWVDELRTRGITQQFLRVRVGLGSVPEMYLRRRAPEPDTNTWHDVQTGDPRFDEAVRVSAPATAPVRAWLSEARRRALLDLNAAQETWAVGDGVLGLSQRGLTPTPQAWREQLATLTRAASELAS